jgi:hypothetical protein
MPPRPAARASVAAQITCYVEARLVVDSVDAIEAYTNAETMVPEVLRPLVVHHDTVCLDRKAHSRSIWFSFQRTGNGLQQITGQQRFPPVKSHSNEAWVIVSYLVQEVDNHSLRRALLASTARDIAVRTSKVTVSSELDDDTVWLLRKMRIGAS